MSKYTISLVASADSKEITQAPAKNSLELYLSDIRTIPLLTRTEESDLALKHSKTGDKQAATMLVLGNLRLVVKIALEFHRRWTLDVMELIQEGNVGLLQAVKHYDPLKGTKLSSYASYWIKAYLLKYAIDNYRLVKIGTTQTQKRLFYNLHKEKRRLEALGICPGPAQLAERFDTDEKTVVEMQKRLAGPDRSLNVPAVTNGKESIIDKVADTIVPFDREMADKEIIDIFKKRVSKLKTSFNDKERTVLDERLLAETPLTLQSIGKNYGITKERVRQIEKGVKNKIKTDMLEAGDDFIPLCRDVSFNPVFR